MRTIRKTTHLTLEKREKDKKEVISIELVEIIKNSQSYSFHLR